MSAPLGWTPLTEPRYSGVRRPCDGQVVAYQFAAWVVVDTIDADPTDDEAKFLAALPADARERMAPYSVKLRRLYGPRRPRERDDVIVPRVPVGYYRFPLYEGGRVPLCSCCQHPWPCRDMLAENAATAVADRIESKTRTIEAGACYGCGDPITTRQATIRYSDDNVEVPLAPGPTFHARWSCRGRVVEYERKRRYARPDAAPVIDVDTGRAVESSGRLL